MQVLDNTPSSGCIKWIGCKITYKGVTYTITDGYTNYRYIYWLYSTPNNFVVSDTFPQLTSDDVLVFLNKSGTHVTVPYATVMDGSLIVPESILANAIAANAITSDKIAANAITSNKIATGAVTSDTIAANAIGADAIAAGVITGDKLVVDAITSRELAVNSVTANAIAANAVGANAIAAGVITTDKLAAGSITADKIAAEGITADKINGGTLALGGISNTSGKFILSDDSGNVIATLDNNGIILAEGKLKVTDTYNLDPNDPMSIYFSSTLSSDVDGGIIKTKYITQNGEMWAELHGLNGLSLGGQGGLGIYEYKFELGSGGPDLYYSKISVDGGLVIETLTEPLGIISSTVFDLKRNGDLSIAGILQSNELNVTAIATINKVYANGLISGLEGSAASLQVNGFQRTGNIYLHSGGNTPDAARTADFLNNTDGELRWYISNTGYKIWHDGNDGSGSGLDADKLEGYHASTTRNSANTIPIRDGNGYLNLGWINTTSGNTTATLSDIYVNTNDGYIRKAIPSHFRSQITDGYYLQLSGGTITGSISSNSSISTTSYMKADHMHLTGGVDGYVVKNTYMTKHYPLIATASRTSNNGAWVTWDYPNVVSISHVRTTNNDGLLTKARNVTTASCEVCMSGTASGSVRCALFAYGD